MHENYQIKNKKIVKFFGANGGKLLAIQEMFVLTEIAKIRSKIFYNQDVKMLTLREH